MGESNISGRLEDFATLTDVIVPTSSPRISTDGFGLQTKLVLHQLTPTLPNNFTIGLKPEDSAHHDPSQITEKMSNKTVLKRPVLPYSTTFMEMESNGTICLSSRKANCLRRR